MRFRRHYVITVNLKNKNDTVKSTIIHLYSGKSDESEGLHFGHFINSYIEQMQTDYL